MKFEKLLLEVIEFWPQDFVYKKRNTPILIEEEVSENLMGNEFELLYRELSYSLMLVIIECFSLGENVQVQSIPTQLIRQKFEERLENWLVEEDGETSDMEALSIYRRSAM